MNIERILRNLFYRTPPVAAFEHILKSGILTPQGRAAIENYFEGKYPPPPASATVAKTVIS